MKVEVVVNNNCFKGVKSGQGPAMILLSGFGCTHYLYAKVLSEIEKSFTVYQFDNRGTGENSGISNAKTSIKEMAGDVHAFMLGLGHEKFSVMGISMGGFIAQELVLNYSSYISSVALLCTSSGGSSFIPLPPLTVGDIKAYYSRPWSETCRQVVLRTVCENTKNDKALLEDIIELRLNNSVSCEAIVNQKIAVDEWLADTKELEQINVPTLVMTGNLDSYVDPKNSEILSEKIKGASLVKIDHGDHLFFLENINETKKRIKEFYKPLISTGALK